MNMECLIRKARHRCAFLAVLLVLSLTVLLLVYYSVESYMESMQTEPEKHITVLTKTSKPWYNCTVTPVIALSPWLNNHTVRNVRVDCSGLTLYNVPERLGMDATTRELDISNNSIDNLRSCQFCHIKGLQYLDLSNNRLTKLDSSSFKTLSSLLFLDLSNNLLSETLFQDDIFKPLTMLTTLRINKCLYVDYPDMTLGKLEKLERLTLDGLSDQDLGKGFKNLTHLTYLSLSGFESRCNISNLTSTMFNNTPHIQYLNISNCGIIDIDIATFSPLKHIFVLNMSDNHILNSIGKVCASLTNTSIQVLILDRMKRSGGHAFRLEQGHLQFCQNLSLRLISLQRNKIDYLSIDAAKVLPNTVELLYLKDNRLSVENLFIAGLIKSMFPCLRKIYAGNVLDRSYSKWIEYNELIQENNIFYEIENLKHKALCNRKVQRLETDYPKTTLILFELPEALEEAYMDNLFLIYSIPTVYMQEKNNISVINLMGNHFFEWDGPINNVEKLTKLDLSINYCDHVSQAFFSNMSALEWLNIRINYLGNALSNDTEGKIFEGLYNLKYLNLFLNRITSLPRKIFKSLSHMEHLDLSHNSLSEFTVDIFHMTHLYYLKLDNNAIESLPADTCNQFEKIARNQTFVLDLSHNELKCTCGNIRFLKWLNNSSVNFTNKDSYTCRDHQWYGTNFTNLDHVIQSLETNCQDWKSILVGVSIAFCAFMFIIAAAVIYKKRWTLRYLYYMTLGRYRLINEDRIDTTYKYDAFVSYESSNRDFVVEEMLLHLEKDGGLKLCIHERDFIPGNAISANIVDSIRESSRTVCVLSNDFLKSSWCMFEFNMAKMESMFSRGGRPVHLLILLDSFNRKNIPLEIVEVMEKQSYIEYPNDEFGNVVFWGKLQETLKCDRENRASLIN